MSAKVGIVTGGGDCPGLNPDYARIPDPTLTRALSLRGRGAELFTPSPLCGRGTG